MKTNFNLFFLAIFLVAILTGWEWPYIAKLMPVYVAAFPGLILIFVQIYRDATDWETRQVGKGSGAEMDLGSDVELDKRTETRRTLIFFAWFISGALGIWLLGIVITLPVLIFLYAFIDGKERWTTSLVMGICTYGLIWGLFEYLLEMRWPPGMFWR